MVWEPVIKKIVNIFTFNHDRTVEKNKKKIIVREATTDYSSGSMEIAGVEAFLDYCTKNQLLNRIEALVVDKDMKVSKFVNVNIFNFIMIQVIVKKTLKGL